MPLAVGRLLALHAYGPCSWGSDREHSSTSVVLRLECSIDCVSGSLTAQ